MKKIFAVTAVALAVSGTPAAAGNVVEVAQEAGSFNTLIAAAKAAGLAGALADGSNLTVFAPTDEAFAKLPEGTVETLLKPENKGMLTKVLTAHVVAGKISGSDLMSWAKAKGGRYNMKTVSGDALTAVVKGEKLFIFDEAGGAAKVTISDVNQSNGVIHVVDHVLVPR